MNILIPMAGAGSRFAKAGYKKPKPLIDVAGKTMIERVVENIGLEEANYTFIAQEAHLKKHPEVLDKLLSCAKNVNVVQIDGLTEGAACTALLAEQYINNPNPLLICNADQWVDWDPSHFVNFVQKKKASGAIPFFLSDSPKHSYSRINFNTGVITEVAEKQVISNFATVGIYYWQHGSEFVECAKSMIEKNIRFNNEFYICPVYNMLIHEKNGKVVPYPVHEMRGMGTPEELQRFLNLLELGQ